jgi:predicted ATP-grasp superfamily ATP-dependent carboligase
VNSLSVLMIDAVGKIPLFVARCLGQAPGIKTHVLSTQTWHPLRLSRHRTSYHTHAIEDDAQWLGAVAKLTSETHIDVLLAAGEHACRFMAVNGDELARLAALAPTPSYESFRVAIDKWELARFMDQHDIIGPHTLLYTAGEAFVEQLAQMEFPALVKPLSSAGGHGIRYFEKPDDMLDYLQASPQRIEQCIAQTYVEGYDIDCSVLCKDGQILAYTIQRCFIPRAQQFAAPAGVEFLHEDKVYDVVRQLMAKLNWTGVAHLDLRYDICDQRPKVIEVNPRYWGSLLGSLMAGINFPYLACLVALGDPIPPTGYRDRRFVAVEGASKHVAAKMVGLSQFDFSLRDTDLRYMLADPLAEMVKIIQGMSYKIRTKVFSHSA